MMEKSKMYTKEILVLQHVEAEGPGLIGTLAKAEGFRLHTIKLFAGEKVPADPRAWSAIVVMGGPMGVYDEAKYIFISNELNFLESAFRYKIPVLGVCLGAQLMARAGGAKVWSGETKEIGFYKISLTPAGQEDRLLLGLPEEFTVFQWHGDTFQTPCNGKTLASSELFDHQLIKIGPNSYGLQFHIEVTEAMIADFLSAGAAELAEVPYIKAPQMIMREARELLPGIHGVGRAIVKRFLRQIP